MERIVSSNTPRVMKAKRFLPFYLFTFILLFLSACGVDSNKFRLSGRLRNMNQGMFWIYSPDGAIEGIDTIQVHEGRFSYETELRVPATFVVIFPTSQNSPSLQSREKRSTSRVMRHI